MQIWLCDDDAQFLESLRQKLTIEFISRDFDIHISTYTTGAELLRNLSAHVPDLILLDVMLHHESGYQIADEIRERQLDSEIIFITNYPEKMPEAFNYKPIGFLSKPISAEALTPMINRFLLQYWNRNTTYDVHNRDQLYRIPLKNILYFESSAHNVLIHTTIYADPISHIKRLSDIEQQLKEYAFVRCHKSFLVRIDCVLSIDRTHMYLHLKNGSSLPISRSCYPQLITQFINYKLR